MIRIQRKTYLEGMISQGDYEYLKHRLKEDHQLSYLFLIRVLADTFRLRDDQLEAQQA